ncbi:hypothetical protein TH5_01720 [Thalassospira xianhensis MCCC 1A02616]|uniref:Cytoplasmic protein n=2 Tax=Thalassospira xianhensis TaxID=478503 RepID=A0A367UHV2_9PROT|nr:hypothetical protein TH5_01720 [Thalassospira xianhensis MCCC 1A02616]
MQNIESPWTTASLKTAFEESSLIDSEEFKVEIVDGASPVLKVTANEFGDIELYVSVVEEQILTSVLLCKRSDIAEQAELEGMMLRNHKTILPLSAFGITTVAGEEWYEIFGAMSARSPISAFVTEVRTIANNAVEVVTELLADLMVQQAA